MAKTRAQRKAERRRRQAQEQRETGGGAPQDQAREAEREAEERAQEDTRLGVSGEVAEAEAVLRTGANPEDYGEHTVERDQDTSGGGVSSPVPGVLPAPVEPEAVAEPKTAPEPRTVPEPEPPADEAAVPAKETGETKRDRRKREKEERRKARAKQLQKAQTEKQEKRRGPVIGFLVSCWAELKRVQWPDRDTLVQASAVTFIFVAVMAAYLGGLDAAFNWLIKQIL